ncbi:hypothetical protein FA95DRAFT_1679551 [Auriscalpium vulgare]|uniref:Uncharacterized protein n=1 Tax=Auriscalpium vulgare TaxID=40419 RepID=A0ACB8RS04_9AGAM|nr:hypothetical protein FA95DRAFT_1679551 [Auriscalpium vulgare]
MPAPAVACWTSAATARAYRFGTGGAKSPWAEAESDVRLRAIQLPPIVLEILGSTIRSAIVPMLPGARVFVLCDAVQYPVPHTVDSVEISAHKARYCLQPSEPLLSLRHLYLINPERAVCTPHYYRHPCAAAITADRGRVPASLNSGAARPVPAPRRRRAALGPRNAATALRHVGIHAWSDDAPGVRVVDPRCALPELQRAAVTRGVEERVRSALEGMCREKGVDLGPMPRLITSGFKIHRRSKSRTEVPLDIQLLLIEWILRLSQSTIIDYTTLRACALVCRAWTPTAQRLLFRRIQREPLQYCHYNIHLLVPTLCTRPHLATHVRSILIAWPPYPASYAADCLRLLELCPHVERISFFDSEGHGKALSAELDAHMHAIQLRPVVLETSFLDEHTCRSLVNMCSGARVLILNDGYAHPLPATVEALQILADDPQHCLPLAQPLPALRSLTVICPAWSDTVLCGHLTSAGILPQLRTLQISGAFPPAEILAQLGQLRTFVVDELPKAPPIALPAPLRHFGYHIWAAEPGVLVLAELVVNPLRALPDLQLVTVTRRIEQHVRAALEGMCRDRGVDFGVYALPSSFQEPRNIDWI